MGANFLKQMPKIMASIENQFTRAKFVFKINRLLPCLLSAIALDPTRNCEM